MGVSISQLPAATEVGEDDLIEISQGGVSKQIDKALLRNFLFKDPAFSFISPQTGDSLTFNGTTFVPGAVSGWRVINQAAYTEAAPASTSTITFVGGVPVSGVLMRALDYFEVGLPVRVEIGAGIYFYGICTAASATLLTLSGAILPLSPIISLAVGTLNMVKHVDVMFPDITYNTLGAAVPLNKGCLHRWRGKTGYLAAYSCSHMGTSATTNVNLKMNGGSNVSTAGVIPAAGTSTTHGAFVDSALGDLIAANVEIEDKQTITVVVPTAGGTASYLIVSMTFIVP